MGTGSVEWLIRNATAVGYCNALSDIAAIDWVDVERDQ